MTRQAFYMEETLTNNADLLGLCAAIELYITQGTLEIYSCMVCSILERVDREEKTR